MKLELKEIQKSYESTRVLQKVSLKIDSNEFFFLLGPSGCGKTTLLRIIAGFIQSDAGTIHLDDRDVTPLQPEKRRIPLVFQNYALWPHLSVFENVAFGLRVMHITEDEVRRRTMEALDVTQMAEYARRFPGQLSGGQQQRVAVARALAVDPPVLLFDEPLSNLDPQLRTQMRQELLEIHRTRPFTAIYVTHDQEEAMTMATRIALMEKGVVHQVGTPRDLYAHPANQFVAEFMGPMNWITARVQEIRGQAVQMVTALGQLKMPMPGNQVLPGQEYFIGFRPPSASITEKGALSEFMSRIVATTDKLLFSAEIVQVLYMGSYQRLTVRSLIDNAKTSVSELRFSILETNPRFFRKIGDHVEVGVESRDLMMVPK